MLACTDSVCDGSAAEASGPAQSDRRGLCRSRHGCDCLTICLSTHASCRSTLAPTVFAFQKLRLDSRQPRQMRLKPASSKWNCIQCLHGPTRSLASSLSLTTCHFHLILCTAFASHRPSAGHLLGNSEQRNQNKFFLSHSLYTAPNFFVTRGSLSRLFTAACSDDTLNQYSAPERRLFLHKHHTSLVKIRKVM